MNDDDPVDEPEPELELVRARARPGDAAEALAHVIAQSNREAAANRAQARELIKALQSVQRSQEYLGTELREERRRSRWLLVLVLAAPVAAGFAVWYVAGRVDDASASVEARISRLARETEAARADDAATFRNTRITELTADLESLRRDLTSSRDALAVERAQVTARETALAEAASRTDGIRAEVGALEFEVRSAKSKANAEAGRATLLEARIRELEKDIAARASAAADEAKAAAKPVPRAEPATSPPPSAPTGASPPAPRPSVATSPATSPSAAERAEAEKTRLLLNTLLAETPDAVRYQFAAIAGVADRVLTGVRIVGTDPSGAVLRTIVADRAEITLDTGSGSVVIKCAGGKLIVGSVEAPFFGGTYGVVLRGDADRWRRSGLAGGQ